MQATEIERLLDHYLAFKRAEGQKESTSSDVRYRIRRIIRECGFTTVASVTETLVVDWFTSLGELDPATGKPKLTANTRKHYHQYFSGFCEWLVSRKYLTENPCQLAPRPKNVKREQRRFRRAMTPNELERLILVARLRPLAEYAKSRMVGSKGKDIWKANPITLENIESLAEQAKTLMNRAVYRRRMLDGLKWSLAYRVAATTGLRWGEIIAIKVRGLVLGTRPEIHLDGTQTKNGQPVRQPVQADLAKDLSEWIAEMGLLRDDPLLPIPPKAVKRFYRDLEAAGIPRFDERGKCLDIHALRYSFGTMLQTAGVQPRMAMKLMRHSKMELTMNLYTDADQLDTRPSIDALPSIGTLPENGWDTSQRCQPQANGAGDIAKPTENPAQTQILQTLLANADPETLRAVLKILLSGNGGGI
jgi:integrase